MPTEDMGHPVGFCKKHGFFDVPSIGISAKGVGLRVKVPCPTCFDFCEVLPGEYSFEAGHLSLLLDESVSPEALKAILDIAARASRKEITAEQAKQEAEKISPKAGRLFDIADWSDNAKAVLYAGILNAAAMLAPHLMGSGKEQSSAPATVVVERVIDRQKDVLRDSTALPYIPIPTPRPEEPR